MNFPSYDFPANPEAIRTRLSAFNPVEYDRSRNFLNGHLSYLSPYISRGVLRLPDIAAYVLKRYSREQCYRFVYELAWREYFQRVWQEKGNAIFTSIRQEQEGVESDEMPAAIVEAQTGIEAIDEAIRRMYATGYMHNHFRMYVAAIVCNVARTRWQTGAEWMYSHLLDADPASNHLSWQWVAATFSAKKYFCNQENINRYSGSRQRRTFLDVSYEEFAGMKVPDVLRSRCSHATETETGSSTAFPEIAKGQKVLLYTPFHLDPEWRKADDSLRILCIRSNGKAPALGSKALAFVRELSGQIPGIRIAECSVDEIIRQFPENNFQTYEHPLIGSVANLSTDPQPRLFPEIAQAHGSFSAFWKRAEKIYLRV